jgi:dienelactone hydrolase
MRSRFVVPLAAAAMLAPAAARAQAVEQGTFVMMRGGDTAMVERFVRRPDGLDGEAAATGAARIVFSARTAADASVTGLDLRVYRAGAADSTPPLQRASVSFAGDSARVTVDAGGQHLDQTVRGARGAIPFFNPSVVLMEQVLMRARAVGGRDSTRVAMFPIGASTSAVPVTVHWVGADSAVLRFGAAEVHARVDALGRIVGAAIPAQRVAIERTARPVQAVRPDYSAPAGAPYTAEEVRVPTPGGWTLAGTLTLPAARAGRIPAVVTITGSGLEDRDEAIPIVPGYRIFRQVADTLGRRGIAVLRLDDRGYGASGGDPTAATSQDFANDVRAAVAYLRARPEIDPDRIALVGHSEGGLIGPMVAVSDPRIRALVAIAGPAWTGRKVIDYQLRYGVEQDTTVPRAKRDSVLRAVHARADSMLMRTAWFRYFLDYDPLPTARRVRQPVLVLQGANDRQVTAEQANELAAAIRAGGNRDVTVRVFPGLDHLMVPDPTGNPARYPTLPSGRVSPDVLGALADWLSAKLR